MPVTQGQGNPDWTRDETVLAMDVLLKSGMKHASTTDSAVRDLSELLRRCNIHPLSSRTDRFRNLSGVVMKIQNLRACADGTGLRTTKTDRAVWAAFHNKPDQLAEEAARIRADLEFLAQTPPSEADDDGVYQENTVRMQAHSRRERARGLRDKVIARARRRHGTLRCEACDCEERTGLGPIAASEFEAHHREPLAGTEGVRNTRVGDFAILCASCHRLIHALMRAEDRTVAIEEFRRRLAVS